MPNIRTKASNTTIWVRTLSTVLSFKPPWTSCDPAILLTNVSIHHSTQMLTPSTIAPIEFGTKRSLMSIHLLLLPNVKQGVVLRVKKSWLTIQTTKSTMEAPSSPERLRTTTRLQKITTWAVLYAKARSPRLEICHRKDWKRVNLWLM